MRNLLCTLNPAPCKKLKLKIKIAGSAEIWTRIAGFRVQSANHYTTEPLWIRIGYLPLLPACLYAVYPISGVLLIRSISALISGLVFPYLARVPPTKTSSTNQIYDVTSCKHKHEDLRPSSHSAKLLMLCALEISWMCTARTSEHQS